jgi:hypothetical protein
MNNSRKNTALKYALLQDRKSGEIVDVCRVHYRETGTMSPRAFRFHRINLALNPFYSNEVYFQSLRGNASYESEGARRSYRVIKIAKDNLATL